jgi:glycosyltransferase involved in cell wall biosynthesis
MKQVLKIGLDAKRAFHNFRGLGNYSRTLIEGLIKFVPESQLFLYTPQFKNKRSIEFAKKISTPQTHILSDEGFWQLAPSLWRTIAPASDVSKQGIDIYHGLSHELPLGLKSKKILTIHDVIFLKHPEYHGIIDRISYKLKLAHAIKNSDLILTTSVATKNDVQEAFKIDDKKIKVHYQSFTSSLAGGLAPHFISKVIIDNDLGRRPYLLCVGAINKAKNVLSLVQAFNESTFLKNNYSLRLVGIVEDRSLANEIKNVENVIIHENIVDAELKVFYREAKLLCLPSHAEGFGIPLLEGMANNCPIACSDLAVFREVACDAAVYFNQNDKMSIVEVLENVLKNKNQLAKQVASGQERLPFFDLERSTSELYRTYEEVMSF